MKPEKAAVKCRWQGRLTMPALSLLWISACSGTSRDESLDPVLHGTIAYPFVDETRAIGREQPEEKFVIRSSVGAREYAIEIPGGAQDYDVAVPLADLGAEDDGFATAGKAPGGLGTTVNTDKEMVAALPRLDRERQTDTAMMDGAFGVGSAEGPVQAPSYTIGIAKINEFYKRRQFEYALVELNNLLVFYPNSPKLHKMKGTVLVRMRNLQLAELAWIKALELEPRDRSLRAALARLQKKIQAFTAGTGTAAPQDPFAQDLSIPKPVGTQPPQPEGGLAH